MSGLLHRIGTVFWLVAFGALSLAYFLTSDKWRADLREANGGGE